MIGLAKGKYMDQAEAEQLLKELEGLYKVY